MVGIIGRLPGDGMTDFHLSADTADLRERLKALKKS